MRGKDGERKGRVKRMIEKEKRKCVCVCMCLCVYVCMREGEREREKEKYTNQELLRLLLEARIAQEKEGR